jgi:glycosyltransferase involved in cell wall biosynthesis
MPSLWPEPFGTVVCEVMSRGRPVIGTRPGGDADIIVDGETGFLVPRGDVPALMRAMRTLLEEDEVRTRMGEAAKVRAEAFTPAVSVPRIEQLYEEIVAANAGA